MLMRSTGLGKAELIAEITEIKRQGDYLVMEMRTSEPVRWKIRGGVSHTDLKTLVKAVFRPSVLLFLLNPSNWIRPAVHPGEF
jgi:hypothetical protein